LHHLIEETGHYKPSTYFQEIFKEGWSCWLDGKKVTSNAELALKEFIFGNHFHEHCHLKENLAPTEFDLINWDAIRDATTTAPNLFNLWMSKQVSGHCAVGKIMKQWNFWEESKCHSCSKPCKDSTHILYCPHLTISELGMSVSKKWMNG
jgi:hypothetical protein